MGKRRLRALGRATLALFALYLAVGYVAPRVRWIRALPPTADSVELPSPGLRVSVALAVHTERSHDAVGNESDVVQAALSAKTDVVLITDHRASDSAPDEWRAAAIYREGVLLLRGQEISLGADVGRTLVFGLDTALVSWERGLEAFARLIERQEATAIVAHSRSPRTRDSWRPRGIPGIVGWEVFDFADIGRARLGDPWVLYHLLALAISTPMGRQHHSLARLHRRGFAQPGVAAFDSLFAAQRLTALGGLDVHPKKRRAGVLIPSYTPFFKAMLNYLKLDGSLSADADSAAAAVAQALSSGRVHIAFPGNGAAREFGFGVQAPGGPLTRMGGEVAWREGLVARAGFGARTPGRTLYRLVRDGGTGVWARGRLAHELPGPGAFRVEAYRYSLRIGRLYWNARPWIFSNPVRVSEMP